MSAENKFAIENKCYQKEGSNFNKLFPSVSFYTKFITQIINEGFLANKNNLTKDTLKVDSFNLFEKLQEIGISITIEGIENIQGPEPVIFIANHMSGIETMILPAIIQNKEVAFIVKDSLQKYPVLNKILKTMEAIPVTQKNNFKDYRKVMSEGEKLIQNNTSIIVFPQGTRLPYFTRESMNSLGSKLAKNTDTKIIPVAIKTDAQSLGKGNLKDFGKIDPTKNIHISFGQSIDSKDDRISREKVNDFLEAKTNEFQVPQQKQ